MNLWFLDWNDPDSDETSPRELLIRCETVEEAITLWRQHYADDEYEAHAGYFPTGYDPVEKAKQEAHGKARQTRWLEDALPDQMWMVHPTNVGALGWRKDDGMIPIYESRWHAIHAAKEALGVSDDVGD